VIGCNAHIRAWDRFYDRPVTLGGRMRAHSVPEWQTAHLLRRLQGVCFRHWQWVQHLDVELQMSWRADHARCSGPTATKVRSNSYTDFTERNKRYGVSDANAWSHRAWRMTTGAPTELITKTPNSCIRLRSPSCPGAITSDCGPIW
jgi:hypothetical protein